MVGVVASRRQRAHSCNCASAQVFGQVCRPIIGHKLAGGMLRSALSISLLVAGVTVSLAESSAMSGSKPAPKPEVAKGVPPSPSGVRNMSVATTLPSPELLKPPSEPDCEIPPSDRLLGAIPETTRLIYERQCYKNAETVVRSKLQLLQGTIASAVKGLNEAAASRSLQPAEGGGEQGAQAPAKDVTVAPRTGTSAKSSVASGSAGDRRGTKSNQSGDQGVESSKSKKKVPKQVKTVLTSTSGSPARAESDEAARLRRYQENHTD